MKVSKQGVPPSAGSICYAAHLRCMTALTQCLIAALRRLNAPQSVLDAATDDGDLQQVYWWIATQTQQASLAGARGSATENATYATDWSVFAHVFRKRKGFEPHPRDSKAMEQFFWFTSGAHHEHLGHLNCKSSNVPDQRPGANTKDPKHD